MSKCVHQQWLRVQQDENGFVLQYGNRLHNISNSLPHPEKQYPSVVFFVGKQSKTRMLRILFPDSSIGSGRRSGLANICLNPTTMNDEYPMLIADSSPGQVQLHLRGEEMCHETIAHPLAWPDIEDGLSMQYDLGSLVNTRLLWLFVDVLCIFAQDCGGLDGVAEELGAWISIGSASSLPTGVRPRLLIVTEIAGTNFHSEVLRFRLRALSDPRFSELFSSLNVVNVLGERRRVSREYLSGLSAVLDAEIELTRTQRINSESLFSMIHTAAFFDMALYDFAKSPSKTFDFIGRTRQDNPVSENFQDHLKSFLRLCSEKGVPEILLWEFIASAIIMDCFPPDMHLFNPSEVFHAFYRHACLNGIQGYADSHQLSSELICADVETHLISMFSEVKYAGQSAAILRRQNLEQNSNYWRLLISNVDCFVCLQRKPEHVMECGHRICDTCVRIPAFSKPTQGVEYHYDVVVCPQCQAKITFQARVLPPTCRVRFLSIDGGGSRGVISLSFMDKFQEALGLPYPVQENFDFSIGTSSGGLVNIGLFSKYWTPRKCLVFFRKFAMKIFPSRMRTRRSICAAIRRIFKFYMEDGKYSNNVMEQALKDALGLGPIFDSVRARPSGMKFAVTATTITDATLCLISNYNGTGSHNKDSRYKHLRATQANKEILLWEAARCTTAAPTYFKPQYLQSFGTFQDGGLKYNNPVRPGLREVRRIWKDGDCDVVLSIGTGYEQKLLSPVAANVRNFFQDGALARFYRASMQSLSLNGQISWDDHWHGLSEDAKAQQFRLNLPLVDKEPEIDDVDKMQYLYDQTQYHMGDIEGIVRAFKAVSFFFELDEPPVPEEGRYRCRASILSRSPDSRALVQSLVACYPHTQFLVNDISFGFLTTEDICNSCGRFRKKLLFYIRHPSDRVNVQLAFNRLFRRSISAFPQPMEWFVGRQSLRAKFGQSDHKSRIKQSYKSLCNCKVQNQNEASVLAESKKRSSTSSVKTRKKRRCL